MLSPVQISTWGVPHMTPQNTRILSTLEQHDIRVMRSVSFITEDDGPAQTSVRRACWAAGLT